MLSRVASNIYWMQRYRERAENLARILEVYHILSSDLPEEEMHWDALLHTFSATDEFKKLYKDVNQNNILDFFTFDKNYSGSIFNFILKARENARTVREVITTEMWQELNTVYLFLQKERKQKTSLYEPYLFFNRVKRQCQLFTGIADTTMSHGLAWHFGRVGYLLERADMTSRLLDVKYYTVLPSQEEVGDPFDNIQWNALLKSVSGLEMYRKKCRHVYYTHVIEFLILDKDFPRSIYSCLVRCRESLSEVDRRTDNDHSNEAKQSLNELIHKLEEMNHVSIINFGMHEFIDHIQAQLVNINKNIFDAFFNVNSPVELLGSQKQNS